MSKPFYIDIGISDDENMKNLEKQAKAALNGGWRPLGVKHKPTALDFEAIKQDSLENLKSYHNGWMLLPKGNKPKAKVGFGLELHGATVLCWVHVYQSDCDYEFLIRDSTGHVEFVSVGLTLAESLEDANRPSIHERMEEVGPVIARAYYQFLDAMGIECPICARRKGLGV